MSAGGTLESSFGIQTLSAAIETFGDEPSQGVFTKLFESGRKIMVDGRTHEWDEIQRPRNLAPVVGEDSPFKAGALTDKKKKNSPIVDLKMFVDIPASKLFRERWAGSLGANVPLMIASELKTIQMRLAKTIEYLCANALLGSIDTSNIEGSEFTVILQQTTSTGNQAAAWSTAGTKIVSDEIPKAVADFVAKTGAQPKIVLLNDVAERSLLKNTEIQTWAQYNNGGRALQSNPSAPQVFGGLGLGGFDWQKAIGVYTDKNGTAGTRYWPDTKVAFLPDQSMLTEVLALAKGYGAIPQKAFGAAQDELVTRAPTPGYYAFAEAISSPVGIRLYAGWAGLPVLLFPGGVYILTIS
jgi:hypothetical protein